MGRPKRPYPLGKYRLRTPANPERDVKYPIHLGVKNDGTIIGVNPDKADDILDALARELHNPKIMGPDAYIPFEKIMIDGVVIHGYVVESSFMHRYLGRFFDMNQDGNFEAKSVHEPAEIIKRKDILNQKDGFTHNFPLMIWILKLSIGLEKLFYQISLTTNGLPIVTKKYLKVPI